MKPVTFLIMGLSGSGKTSFALQLVSRIKNLNINVTHFNGDHVRRLNNDWDFSENGRIVQANRMKQLANVANKEKHIAVCDFICPTHETQLLFKDDVIIFMDTVSSCKYLDTNSFFQKPTNPSYTITTWNYQQELKNIIEKLTKK